MASYSNSIVVGVIMDRVLETDKQADKLEGIQTDRVTDNHTDIQIYIHAYIYTSIHISTIDFLSYKFVNI